MATAAQEGLTHRVKSDGATTVSSRDSRRAAKAKHGMRSLAAAVSVAAALTVASFWVAGAPEGAPATVALVRAGSVGAAAVMALAAWMVWAEGGFHRRPAAVAPFLAHFVAALAWPPLVLGLGAVRTGLAACAAMAAGAVACVRMFGGVHTVAGDLAKPCVAWAVLLAVMNCKMLSK